VVWFSPALIGDRCRRSQDPWALSAGGNRASKRILQGATVDRGIDPGLSDGTDQIGGQDRPLG
jgi:hypothetical protein